MRIYLFLGLVLLVGMVSNADAAQLKEKYRDDRNDLVCVYDSHGHSVTVNAGFSGHCSYSVPDDEF